MAISVKICGLNAPDAVTAAIEGGAFMVGFVFYPRSPRSLAPEAAGKLASMVPEGIGASWCETVSSYEHPRAGDRL